MPFNATSVIVQTARLAGLVIHEPLRRANVQRGILCPPEENAQLSGDDPNRGVPALGISITIGRFIGGLPLVVSRRKRELTHREPAIELEQLEGMNEVWVICYRHPRPGWRILGRFLGQDVFVALRVKDKRDIGSDYGPAAAEVISAWNTYFPTRSPCSGDDLSVYISGDHFNADEER